MTATPTSRPAKRKHAAYEELLELLMSGDIEPGEIINRRAIAAQLEMSVAPVHEAMLRLEGEGFLEVLPNKGTRVRSVRPRDVLGNFIVREAIECQAARLYAGVAIKRGAGELAAAARLVEDSPPGTRENWQSEVAFHQGLVDLADVPALSEQFKRVMRIGLFFQLNAIITPASERTDNHSTLLRKLKTAAPADAEDLIRKHLRTTTAQLFAQGGIR